jgi:hypothetical protein
MIALTEGWTGGESYDAAPLSTNASLAVAAREAIVLTSHSAASASAGALCDVSVGR